MVGVKGGFKGPAGRLIGNQGRVSNQLSLKNFLIAVRELSTSSNPAFEPKLLSTKIGISASLRDELPGQVMVIFWPAPLHNNFCSGDVLA